MPASESSVSLPVPTATRPVVVCALYRFVRLDDFRDLRGPLRQLLLEHGITGTLLLAPEGINGTVAGTRAAIDTLLAWLRRDARLAALEVKESGADTAPFLRSRVRLKQEIVTMGVPGIDPGRSVGTYVEPRDWNALISDPEVLVIDTRNDYEIGIGRFRNAVNPRTRSFREFPRYVRAQLDPSRQRKVAMYCTGGIRCEKSTALLRELGFEEVFHLHGGILKYLEQVPEGESLWEGECFVFDERVTVDHRLQPGSYRLCHACRTPLGPADLQHPDYLPGVRCPHCALLHTPQRQRRFAEREKQMQLARIRGEAHLGAEAGHVMRQRHDRKQRDRQRQREHASLRNTRHR